MTVLRITWAALYEAAMDALGVSPRARPESRESREAAALTPNMLFIHIRHSPRRIVTSNSKFLLSRLRKLGRKELHSILGPEVDGPGLIATSLVFLAWRWCGFSTALADNVDRRARSASMDVRSRHHSAQQGYPQGNSYSNRYD